jgi:hypothetical protein
MENDVTCIDEDPIRGFLAFDDHVFETALFQGTLDIIC